MRIVGGRHKGRIISGPHGHEVRPTSDRVRESVFNILEHRDWGESGLSVLTNAHVLDAFCGTGALGLEALSRGAYHTTFMDISRDSIDSCRTNVGMLNEYNAATILRGDCLKPVRPSEACNLVFLDPPYKERIAMSSLEALAANGWIANKGICVIETRANQPLETPSQFENLDQRKYGAARLNFLRYRHDPNQFLP